MSATSSIERRSASNDRLVYTLFAAILLHGLLILGLTFEAMRPAPQESPSLEVVLVPDGPTEVPDESARYLAQRAQRGSGESGEGRPAAQASNAESVDNLGLSDSQTPTQTAPGSRQQQDEFVVSPSESDVQVLSEADVSPNPHEFALDARMMVSLPESSVLIDTPHQSRPHSDNPRERLVSVDTREVQFAAYLESWRRRIEQVGTLNYPDEARRRGLAGSPVLEVAVGADGGLRDIRVIEASPHRQLDQAALRILRLAAPFDPFPAALRDSYDSLRFVYEWRFSDGRPESVRTLSFAPENKAEGLANRPPE